jgi:hypothetical protein
MAFYFFNHDSSCALLVDLFIGIREEEKTGNSTLKAFFLDLHIFGLAFKGKTIGNKKPQLSNEKRGFQNSSIYWPPFKVKWRCWKTG